MKEKLFHLSSIEVLQIYCRGERLLNRKKLKDLMIDSVFCMEIPQENSFISPPKEVIKFQWQLLKIFLVAYFL